jgi:putative phage-type endonuclease
MIAYDSGLTHSTLVNFKNPDEWLAGRRGSIGSSECAILLGLGYAGSSKYSLWAEKVHGYEKPIADDMLRYFKKGKLAEPYLAGLVRLDHGWDVQHDPDYCFRRSISHPFMTASLDAWMIEHGEHVAIEFKDVSAWVGYKEWDPKSGKAPLKYTIQLQHQLAVTGWNKGYLVALCGLDTTIIPVKRHEALVEQLQLECSDFWELVEKKIEPEIDDSEATHSALKEVYKREGRSACTLSDEASGMIDLILELEASIDRDTEMLERHRNELLRMVEGAEELVTTDGQWYTFKAKRGGKRRLTKKVRA